MDTCGNIKHDYFEQEEENYFKEASFLLAEREHEQHLLLQEIIEEENKAVLFTVKIGVPVKVSPYFYIQPRIYEHKQQLGGITGRNEAEPNSLLFVTTSRERRIHHSG